MENPLRSEAQMFRLVVMFGAAALVVIAAALIIDPLAGLDRARPRAGIRDRADPARGARTGRR